MRRKESFEYHDSSLFVRFRGKRISVDLMKKKKSSRLRASARRGLKPRPGVGLLQPGSFRLREEANRSFLPSLLSSVPIQAHFLAHTRDKILARSTLESTLSNFCST